MCANNCITSTRDLSLPNGNDFTHLNLKFGLTAGGLTDYGKFELHNALTPCCQNIDIGIGGQEIGIKVIDFPSAPKLRLSAALSNRKIVVSVPINQDNPRIKIYKAVQTIHGVSETNIYLIGIDDIRSGFDDCYYKFQLTGTNDGVNVKLENGKLVISGGN